VSSLSLRVFQFKALTPSCIQLKHFPLSTTQNPFLPIYFSTLAIGAAHMYETSELTNYAAWFNPYPANVEYMVSS